MSDPITDQFIAALHALEAERNAEPLAMLHSEGAKIGNVLTPDQFTGPDGARRFWSEYRGTFETLRSEFRNVIASDGRSALEWTTTGTAFDGKPFTYSGVSLLETEGSKITRFAAYFDPNALGRQIEPAA